jgi:tetratricopeptide (TPR) repeat protein
VPVGSTPSGASWSVAAKHIAAGAVVFLSACVAYSNADHDRLYFDSLQLTQDPLVRDFGQAVRRLQQTGPRPGQELTLLTFAANYAWNVRQGLPGLDPTGFLVVNVLLHAANSVLVYCLILAIQRTGGPSQRRSVLAAMLGSVLFAVHPLGVTSVVYVLQRRGLLTVFFYLVALLSFLHLRSARRLGGQLGWGLVIALAFVLGIKSKTQALTLPVSLLALAFCVIASDTDRVKRYLRWAAPLFFVCAAGIAAVLAMTGWFDLRQFRFIRTVAPAGWDISSQFFTQMRVLAEYWKLILLPWPGWLSIDHPFRAPVRVVDATALALLAVHAGLAAAGIYLARRGWRLAGFGLLLYYIGFVPWLFTPQGEQLVEYKSYLSSIGVFLVVAELIGRAPKGTRRAVLIPGLCLVTLIFLVTTRQRNRILADPITLWRDVITKYPNNFRAYVSLGVSFAEVGRHSEAMEVYRHADRLQPYNAQLHYYMGNALRDWGQLDQAVAEFREAHRIAGGDLHIVINLASTLSKIGQSGEAIEAYRRGLAMANPETSPAAVAQARFNLGNELARQGALAEAEEEYRRAIETDPSYANAHYGLGLVLWRQNRRDEALEALYTALRIRPDFPDAKRAVQAMMGQQTTQPP